MEDQTDGGPNWCLLDLCATASSSRLISFASGIGEKYHWTCPNLMRMVCFIISDIPDDNKDQCIPNPCKNGAQCTDGYFSYTCTCEPDYTGRICEQSKCTLIYRHFSYTSLVPLLWLNISCMQENLYHYVDVV